MFKAVIFDLDGTILNTLDDLADSGNHILASMGFPTHPTEAYKYFVGNGIPNLIHSILPDGHSDEIFQRALADFEKYYSQHKQDKTAPYLGIPKLLADLKSHSIRLCVLSNKQHDLCVAIVRHYFGSDMFDIICGKREEFPVKPNPESCNNLVAMLGLSRSEVLYVGDSNVDMQTGKNAGLVKCGVSWGFRGADELKAAGADHIAETPDDILNIALENN